MTIESLGKYIELTERMCAESPNGIWFRGQARRDWKLTPAAFRGFTSLQEIAFYREFRLKAPSRSSELPDTIDLHLWITLMRHHGLPTRLIDWSSSPLVALFFAVIEETDSDGSVYVLGPFKLNQRSLGKYEVPHLGSSDVGSILQPPFLRKSEEPTGKIAAVISEENSSRMLMQQGMFTIHSYPRYLDLAEYPDCVNEITVNTDLKETLRKSLFRNGIRRASLFPDLDNLAKDLVENIV